MSRWRRRARPLADTAALGLAATLLAVPAAAGPFTLGGDARYYQFFRLDEPGPVRRDAELGIVRLKLDGRFAEALTAEAHGVVALISPAADATAAIAASTTRRFFDLEHAVIDEDDGQVLMELDRLNLAAERRGARLVVGRQAITWGVNFFWPVLDRFAPFAPQRVDREYKPGVDAVRLTLPLGRFSQVEAVAAGQGRNLRDNGSVGALARVHVGAADLGLLAGAFHNDTVVGGFVTADVLGTGLRAEAAFTESADALDAAIGRERFWQVSAGVDRQLTPTLTLMAEAAWNQFGASDPDDYPRVAATDRVRRGEVTALGRAYVGGSLAWQALPIFTLTGTGLANLTDASVLLLPTADLALSDSVSLVLGGALGVGPGRRADGRPRSEYGAAPDVLWIAVKVYF